MSAAETALSISIKMGPGPEHRQEPVAPDKAAENNNSEISNERDVENPVVVVETVGNQNPNTECASTNIDIDSDSTNQSAPTCVTSDSKQVSYKCKHFKQEFRRPLRLVINGLNRKGKIVSHVWSSICSQMCL